MNEQHLQDEMKSTDFTAEHATQQKPAPAGGSLKNDDPGRSSETGVSDEADVRKVLGIPESYVAADPAGDFVNATGGFSYPVEEQTLVDFIATETQIFSPSRLPSLGSVHDEPARLGSLWTAQDIFQDEHPTRTVKKDDNDGNDLEKLLLDTGVTLPTTLPDVKTVYFAEGLTGRRRVTAEQVARAKANLPPRVLIVGEEDSGLTDHLDFHLRALEKRMSRDDMQAMRILKRFRASFIEFDDRERYYKRKHLLAWQAAIAMARTKKTSFETDIPLAATSFLTKRLPKKERIRRRILQVFGCCHSSPGYVDEVLTQLSVDNFNARYEHMKPEEVLPGFGLQRRKSIFSSTHPKFIEYDDATE